LERKLQEDKEGGEDTREKWGHTVKDPERNNEITDQNVTTEEYAVDSVHKTPETV